MITEMPKISIIVPVYGVEKYIGKCIESLCCQTWKNLEILLVDDGSKDQSGKICDEWAKKDLRIRVLHIKNGGQSHARNVGLDVATGAYIGFVDGDDAANPNMYETLINQIMETGAEIAECNFRGRKSSEPDQMEKGQRFVMSGKSAIQRQLDIKTVSRFPSTSLWSKLFLTELIHDMRLPEGKIHEEYAFLCQAFCRCETYVYINEILYERTLREDSTTAAAFSDRAFDKLEVYRQRNRFLLASGEQQLYMFSREQEFDLMLYYYGEACRNGLSKRARELEQEMFAAKKEILKSGLPKNRMRKYRLFFVSPLLYHAIRRMIRS